MIPSPRPDPSQDQRDALTAFDEFLASRDQRVFVLSGAAGTGKTTLLSRMLEDVARPDRRAHLAALTGRAATIARLRTGTEASTLHSFLYRFDPRSSKVVDGLPRLVFSVRSDNPVSVLFVDEASMLGSTIQGEPLTMSFGTGNLAADLVGYLFGSTGSTRDGAKLVLVGDPYQLEPVGDDDSIVFNAEGWSDLTKAVVGEELPTVRVGLETVHRQSRGGVLELATQYRDALVSGEFRTTPRPPSDDPQVAADSTARSSLAPWAEEVADHHLSTVVITPTNSGTTVWNRLVRQARWGDPNGPVREGDLLATTRRDPRTGLDNGEILEVRSAATNIREVTHLGRTVRLRRVAVRSIVGGEDHDALLDDNALESDERTMSRGDSQVLWVDFELRHRDIRRGTPEFWDAAYRDPILNPIVGKYGYALTCHKAQGGQWDRVIVDFNQLHGAPDSEQAFRWAYTAITRARSNLVLIDQPYRSPFSRLATLEPDRQAAGSAAGFPEPSPGARRTRAESAVASWAQAHGHEVTILSSKDYNTRFEVADGVRSFAFDVYFDRGGAATKRLSVRADVDPTGDLMPPLPLIERASFEGMPRPSDARVELELIKIEDVLRLAGMSVTFLQVKEWVVDLQVGLDEDVGVMILNFRKSGVFSARQWRRRPGQDVQNRVDEVMNDLAHG